MALTRITTDGITDGSIINVDINASAAIASSKISGLVGGATGVDFNDNVKARWGTGNDLQIFHDGTDSIISNATNVLKTHSTNTYLRNAAGNEELATFTQDGAVKLYYDNSKKFETTSYGSAHTGVMRFENSGDGISLYDSRELKLGNGDDLKIYHDGTDNYWETGATTTHFRVNSGNRLTINGTTGDVSMQGSSGKNFLWDNSAAYLNLNDNARATYGTGDDLQIYHDGSDSFIDDAGTGKLFIRSNEVQINKYTGETLIKAVADGATQLYYDNSAKIETVPTGGMIQSPGDTDVLLKIKNTVDSNASATCTIQAEHDNRGSSKIVFGRENANDWSASWASQHSFLGFHTFNGSNNLQERMRINGAGDVLVGTATSGTSSATSGLYLSGLGSVIVRRNGNMSYWKTLDTGGYNTHVFLSANTTVGTIVVNSGGTQFNTSSDYRLKENVVDLTGAITRVKNLKPKRFNFIRDETNTLRDGFLAHEVSSLVPEAITGTKDAVAAEDDDESGTKKDDPVYQQIDQSKLVPLLTAALQEAIAKIETLETKVAALGG